MHRQDPPSKDQFGDGKYSVEWTKDLEKYEQWWAQGTRHTQQLARQLEEQGRPKSAARVSPRTTDCSGHLSRVNSDAAVEAGRSTGLFKSWSQEL